MSTNARRKRAYHHGDLEAALTRAAGKILEKEGVEGLKLRSVARLAGVSHNAPYRHFPRSEALLAALAVEGFEALGEVLRKAAAAGGLRAMGEAYVAFAIAQPQRFRLMFGGRIPLGRHARLREVATRSFADLAGALSASVPGAQDANDSSLAAWALVHGLAQLLLGNRLPGASRRGRGDTQFVREILSSVRFAAIPAQSAA